MASSSTKRCHYEVLGLDRDCTADEIRSTYKKLALQRHPDKLIQSGLSQAEATCQFQELVHAYEVLSDPKERAWYDSHRSQILFSDPDSANSVPDSVIPNLFSYFSNTVYSSYTDTGRGFYKVYGDVFNKIYANEVNFCRKLGLGLESVKEAPLMGNLESPYGQVSAFYNYWLGFCTVMDFCWVDQYDAMAGPNRKSRRVMEEENKKLRKKAKREYNETVRGLAEFVKKRDKRVIDMMIKKNATMEKRKEEERERKMKAEREKVERMKAYEEPEWARVNEEELEELEEEETEMKGRGDKQEFYCVVCGKKFKSEKQWKNHEQSKKHKEKVAELRESFMDEDELREDIEEDEEEIDHGTAEIEERFKEDFTIGEDGSSIGAARLGDEEDEFIDAEDNGDRVEGVIAEDMNNDEGNEDDDIRAFEAMMFGCKSRCGHPQDVTDELKGEVHTLTEEIEAMEYDNWKSRRKIGKKERGKKNGGEAIKADKNEERNLNQEASSHDNGAMEDSSSRAFVENENNGVSIDNLGRNLKNSHQPINKKAPLKEETKIKIKKSTKGKKGKTTSRNSGNLCETCGEEFESRNKLHKHLGDTGHAILKHR